MTLNAHEFIRRFLLHVVPDGFQRICDFGLLGNRGRPAKLARCQQLLDAPLAASNPVLERVATYPWLRGGV